MIKYIVKTSSAKTPTNRRTRRSFGTYRNVAVLKLTDRDDTPRIDERISGVEIVWHSGRVNVGTTDRCAYSQALRKANELAEQLNAQN